MIWFSVDEIFGRCGKCPRGLRRELEPAHRIVDGRRVWVEEDVEPIIKRLGLAA